MDQKLLRYTSWLNELDYIVLLLILKKDSKSTTFPEIKSKLLALNIASDGVANSVNKLMQLKLVGKENDNLISSAGFALDDTCLLVLQNILEGKLPTMAMIAYVIFTRLQKDPSYTLNSLCYSQYPYIDNALMQLHQRGLIDYEHK